MPEVPGWKPKEYGFPQPYSDGFTGSGNRPGGSIIIILGSTGSPPIPPPGLSSLDPGKPVTDRGLLGLSLDGEVGHSSVYLINGIKITALCTWSIVLQSEENLFRMLPRGVVSKNLRGNQKLLICLFDFLPVS